MNCLTLNKTHDLVNGFIILQLLFYPDKGWFDYRIHPGNPGRSIHAGGDASLMQGTNLT